MVVMVVVVVEMVVEMEDDVDLKEKIMEQTNGKVVSDGDEMEI